MMRKLILLLAVLILISSCGHDANYFSDPYYVLDSAGVDREEYVGMLDSLDVEDKWASGDIFLMLARLENNSRYYREACKSFKSFVPETEEEKALLHETLGSLNCRCREKEYKIAAALWWKLGVGWRAEMLESLSADEELSLVFETSVLEPGLELSDAPYIIIGNSSVTINKGDKVITQNDRVLRDWLGVQLQNPFRGEVLKTFSERLTYDEEELREDIGWHEGGRLLDIMESIEVKRVPVVGTVVAKHGGKWYAPDEGGVFRFEVPQDKVSYPTTRFLSEDIAVIIDTHGINMMVEQTVRNDADVAIGCCDHPGKIKAALHLSRYGTKVLCFTDLDAYRLLGHNSEVLGSPPMEVEGGSVVFGSRPVRIYKHETVVVTDSGDEKYALWYYKAPALYFREIIKTFPLQVYTVKLDDFNQANKIYERARETKAKIVATRVFNRDDYEEAKIWLEESKDHKVILFHSASYPYGKLISEEYPKQISFNDPNPQSLRR